MVKGGVLRLTVELYLFSVASVGLESTFLSVFLESVR
jgi:hypothetical protein